MQTTNTIKILSSLLLLLPFMGMAQTQSDRWALSLGGGANRYLSSPIVDQPISPLYDPSIGIAATRYLRGGFDFRTQLFYTPQARIPMADGTRAGVSLVDMNYQLMFKFNNGVFMRETAFFAPYLLFGIGGSYAPELPDAYVPLGGGIRFRLSQRMSLRVETVRKFSLNKQAEQMAHAIAFVYNLPSNNDEAPSPMELEEPDALFAEAIPMDRDQDGILDDEDQCPDDAGLVRLNGCPENKTVSNTEESPVLASADQADDPFAHLVGQMPNSQNELINGYAPLPSEVDPNEPMGKMGNINILAMTDEMPAESTSFAVNTEPEPVKVPFDAPTDKETPKAKSLSTKEKNITDYPPIDETARQEITEVIAPEAVDNFVEPKPSRRPELDSPCGDFGVAPEDMYPILFPTNSYSLEDDAYSTLDLIAEAMQSCPKVNLVLEGHTDAMGADDKNLVLSVMRAYNVKYYLVYEHGISQQRILSKGKGETAPIADNSSLQGRDQNRRVDFRFIF
ncbi:MAG: OmpA family protein [Bacteroidota bacterium]